MSAKLLKVSFVILLLVTVGELGYYFIILKQQPSSYQADTASRPIEINQQAISAEKTQQNAEIKKNIDDSILFYRNRFKTNENGRIYIVLEQLGVVNTVVTKKGSTTIFITNEKGEKISNFVITEKQKFYRMLNDEKVQVPFQEVKTGEKIIIRVEKNLSTNEEKLEFILPNA